MCMDEKREKKKMFEYVNDARKEIMNICFHSSREMCIINFISNYFWAWQRESKVSYVQQKL